MFRVFLLLLTLLPGALLGQERPPTPVIVAEVLEQPLVEDLSFVGRILPMRSSRVAAETEGRVLRRFAEAGQTVRGGDPLFELANDPLQASLAEAQADFELRQFNYDRSRQLRATDSVSEQDLRDNAYELARAQAKLAGLQAQVEDLFVRAPFSGHIIQTFTEIGQWVGRGGEIAQVISIDTVRVYVDVPERYVSQFTLGDRADIFVDALGGDPIAGLVAVILAEGYASSHTFPVVVGALNPDGRMRSNMSARVRFQIAQPKTSILVHKDALVSGPQGQVVYLARDGKAVQHPVETGLAHKGYVAVTGELAPGDLAVVRGNERLMDGQAVRIIRRQP